MPKLSFKKLLVILLLVVSTPTFATSQADSSSNLSFGTDSIQTPEYKARILLNKVLSADLIYIEMQDREFLRDNILINNEDFSTSEVECVIDSTYDNYRENLYNTLLGYTKEYPKEAIDLWLNNLDFLAEINAKIINYPEIVSFDTNNLSTSSALSAMTNAESLRLQSIILDARFSKLLALIGLPTLNQNSQLINLFNVSTLYSFALMQAAINECNENLVYDK